MNARDITGAALEIAELALRFGRIDRTGVCHPDGKPETDSDHTVMLGWLAPALGSMVGLRAGVLAEFALIHDACEVYAGDTPTIDISPEDLLEKYDREAVAVRKLYSQFRHRVPWFAEHLLAYERQVIPEARFVRVVDKCLPKLVHLIDKGFGLKKEGVTQRKFRVMVRRQREQLQEDFESWPMLQHFYDELVARILREDNFSSLDSSPQPKHTLTMNSDGTWWINHVGCLFSDANSCEFTLAVLNAFRQDSHYGTSIGEGTWTVQLDHMGEIVILG